MAIRDKSQGVGFVYTNIYEIYKKAQTASSNLKSDAKVWRADELANVKVTKFQPRTLAPAAPVASAVTPNSALNAAVSGNPFDDLKANINRLHDLHSKLRFMLKELEDLVNKK